jgi:hypothetical protein
LKAISFFPAAVLLNFILFSCALTAQNTPGPQQIIVSGKITSVRQPEGVPQVIIRVKNRYGLIAQDTSGKSGDYHLKLISDSTITLEFAKPYPLVIGENLQYETTFHVPRHACVLNVQLNSFLACGGKDPLLYFKKGSAELDLDYAVGMDSNRVVVEEILALLKNNPSLVLEIGSNLSVSEPDGTELSLQRARTIYEFLLTEGVNRERLVPKSYGKTRLRFTEKELNKLKTPLEKEEMDKRNRRVAFRIIRME